MAGAQPAEKAKEAAVNPVSSAWRVRHGRNIAIDPFWKWCTRGTVDELIAGASGR